LWIGGLTIELGLIPDQLGRKKKSTFKEKDDSKDKINPPVKATFHLPVEV